MKTRITAIRRQPIDTAGLLSALIDLAVQLQRQKRAERNTEVQEKKPRSKRREHNG
jgi:hypothetical protein